MKIVEAYRIDFEQIHVINQMPIGFYRFEYESIVMYAASKMIATLKRPIGFLID
jgi:hypothetical protein